MQNEDLGAWWKLGNLTRLAPAIGVAVTGHQVTDTVDVRGVCARGASQRANMDDQWHLGSCTKLFTCCLWAKLVERTQYDWTSSVGEYFDGEIPISEGWHDVTVGELLQHRVSVSRDLSPKSMYEHWHDSRDLAVQRTLVAMDALSSPTKPVSHVAYSNVGYIIVGAIIDRLGFGQFETVLQEHILDELAIQSAGFGPPARLHGHRARLSLGPVELGRSSPRDPQSVYSDNPAVYSSAGTLNMSLRDVLSFLSIFVDPTASLLQSDSYQRVLDTACMPVIGSAENPTEEPDACFEIVGSNTMWSAAFVIDRRKHQAAAAVANDGRSRVVNTVAQLAQRLVVESTTAS